MLLTYFQRKEQNSGTRKRKGHHESDFSDTDSDGGISKGEGGTMKQCFGPQCIKAARINSKYCSDECGLKLAEARVYSVRKNSW